MNTAKKRQRHGLKALKNNGLGLEKGHKSGRFCVLSSLFSSQLTRKANK
tara:strand:- start:336 stop:482 length:147 start_codon:yes stop_codon:yes gene_type:complete